MFQFSPSPILALSKLYEKSPITVDVTLMVPSVSVYDVDVNTSIHLSPPPFLALSNYFLSMKIPLERVTLYGTQKPVTVHSSFLLYSNLHLSNLVTITSTNIICIVL